MEVKEGYKQTEVGVIPEDWVVKELDEIGSFKKGKGIKKDEVISDGIFIEILQTYYLTDAIIKQILPSLSNKIYQLSDKKTTSTKNFMFVRR